MLIPVSEGALWLLWSTGEKNHRRQDIYLPRYPPHPHVIIWKLVKSLSEKQPVPTGGPLVPSHTQPLLPLLRVKTPRQGPPDKVTWRHQEATAARPGLKEP